jgi:glycosyltransferase involved in cell wall biosynthesis
MRIACLLRKGIYYGAENMTVLAARYMAKKNEVLYCSPEGIIQEYLKDTGVTHVPIEKVSVKTIKYLMKTFKPDIFLVLDNKASMIAAVAGVPFVSYQQNNWPFVSYFSIYTLGMLFYCLRAKRIIGVTDEIINKFRFAKYIRDKYVTILNVVDLSYVKELAGETAPPKEYDICYFGRMTDQKRPELFLNVVKKVCETRPETTVVMIGDGELMQDVKALAERLELTDNITFTGFLKNPFEIVNKARLLVLTSLFEGFCIVAVEAMCLGLPVVASRVPVLDRNINDSCGVLCDTENDFYKAIIELLFNEELYDKKSQGAIERAKIFGDVEKYAADIEKVCVEAAGV